MSRLGPQSRTRPPQGAAVAAALAATALTLGALPASAMPPPAPGNSRGLPPAVRESLLRDPSLFYPKKGFRDVVERQRVERERRVIGRMQEGMTRPEAEQAAAASITVTRYCPVLCGIYADKPSPDWPVADLVDELFSLDYGATNPLGQPGSMREHYRDMSYGTFDLQGGVFGWFSVPENGLYYYSDDNGLGAGRDSGEAGAFIRHTLQASDPSVDFRIYDNDGPDNVPDSGDDDGYADLVMFVHPNEGGECGGSDIWSHSFSYSGWTQHAGQPFVTDDIGANGQPIRVDDYVIMPAISCFGGRIEIGVFSHEFGHALGLPDLYDRTAYDPAGAVSTGGMGLFCLMAAGSYGGDYSHPATPTQMCAWAKEELGWLTATETVCDETAALYYQGDAPEARKLWRGGDYSSGEWFLVENRQRVKWDRYLRGEGFLVTHIDNNVTTQNDEACPGGNPCPAGHYLVMVIEADNQWEMQTAAPPVNGPWFGEAEDFFNAANNDTWDDSTLPSARDHAGAATGVSVHNIGPSGIKMMADFSVAATCTAVPDLALLSARVTGGCDLDGFLDPGETASLTVALRNFPTAAPADDISATLTSESPEVSVVSGTAAFPDLGRGQSGETIVPFQIVASGAAACATTADLRLDLTAAGGYATSIDFTVPVGLDSLFVPITPFLDDIESGDENGWKHYAYINTDDWSHNTNANHTTGAIPGHSWFTAAPATGKDVSLEPPPFVPTASSLVSFWHRYDTEDDWDGCLLELSTDGGATWTDVGDLTNVGYDDAVMVNPQSSISGRRCWNGLSAGYPLFEEVTLALAPWAGQTCLLRFRMGTDLAATGVLVPGWNVDDYQVTDAAILRQQCEATALCEGIEADPPSFAGLESATNIGSASCDAVDLKWSAASDASPPVSYLIYASTTTPVPTGEPIASTSLLKYRVTGLTPNATYHFLVRARDAQGNVDGNGVERDATLACEAPDIVLESVQLVETQGCDGDGRPDGGEIFDVVVQLRNQGSTNAQDVAARLESPTPWIGTPQWKSSYGELPSQHLEPGAEPFQIAIASGTPCLTEGTLVFRITAAGGYEATRTYDLVLESDEGFVSGSFFDDVEGTEPNGFTHSAEAGIDSWGYVTSDSWSPTHSWFHPDAGDVTNSSLVSPPLFVTESSVLSFRHKYVLEAGFDGAVLEISTDDGFTWTDIGPSYNSLQEPVGPAFGSPFAPGTPFWSGSSPGWVAETVEVGAMTSALGMPLYAGQTVLIRWRIGCDNTNSEPPFVGWWIDDISFTDTGTFTTVCDATGDCQVVDVPDGPAPGRITALAPNRPNPMRGWSVIEFEIAREDEGPVVLTVYDVAGRAVRRLVDEPRSPGAYQVTWDGRDDAGAQVQGGIYFYQLRVGEKRLTRKLSLIP